MTIEETILLKKKKSTPTVGKLSLGKADFPCPITLGPVVPSPVPAPAPVPVYTPEPSPPVIEQ